MVFRKQIPAGSTGTSIEFGGDDINVYDKFLSGTDVTASITGPANINTAVEWESGKLSIGNGTNANKISITSSAQSSSYNLNIPILSGSVDFLTTGTAAGLSTANTFTAIQTISSDNQRILKLYRPSSTANNIVGFEADHMNASSVQTEFARWVGKLITNTAGAEVGMIEEYVNKAGTVTKVRTIDQNGAMLIGPSLIVAVGGVLKNSGVTTTTASSSTEFDMLNYSVPANLLGTNGSIKVRVSGYVLQNQVTATDFTLRIKFGGTTLYQSTIAAMAQSAINKPWILEFEIGNKNATNSQGMAGKMIMNDASTPTTGEGSIASDEGTSNGCFRAATGASTKDTTSAQVLAVTMTMSVNNASVSTSVQRQIIEFIPGI